VHDSSAKLPSGVLNGNVNQYGDIDQCLNVRSPWQGGVIKGRYCLTTTVLRLSDSDHPLLGQVQQLLQSHSMLRSELDDVSAFGESWFDSRHGQEIYVSSTASWPPLRPIQPPDGTNTGAFSPRGKRPECEDDHLKVRLRMHEAIPTLHHWSFWCGS
jgi:hypothetical protein